MTLHISTVWNLAGCELDHEMLRTCSAKIAVQFTRASDRNCKPMRIVAHHGAHGEAIANGLAQGDHIRH